MGGCSVCLVLSARVRVFSTPTGGGCEPFADEQSSKTRLAGERSREIAISTSGIGPWEKIARR